MPTSEEMQKRRDAACLEDLNRLNHTLHEIHLILSAWEFRLTDFTPEGKAYCPVCGSNRSITRWFNGYPIALVIEHAPHCAFRRLAALVNRHPRKQIWKNKDGCFEYRQARRAEHA